MNQEIVTQYTLPHYRSYFVNFFYKFQNKTIASYAHTRYCSIYYSIMHHDSAHMHTFLTTHITFVNP